MIKVTIEWAGDCSETNEFPSMEEATKFINDVVSPGSNIRYSITEEK